MKSTTAQMFKAVEIIAGFHEDQTVDRSFQVINDLMKLGMVRDVGNKRCSKLVLTEKGEEFLASEDGN